MNFSSVPVYLDPPNWHQQTNYQPGGGSSENPQLHQQQNQQQQQHQQQLPPSTVGGAPGSIRPGSMADRARMAKVPQPEAALKCPRCESTNTKFCYFNNYSLSQPRHFCKTCRRYWTRGGALRNVPVGGGCRRNKRSKSRSSKSPSAADRQSGPGSASSVPSNSSTSDIIGHLQHHPQFPFVSPLQHLSEFGAADMGLNFAGLMQQQMAASSGVVGGRNGVEFQLGGNSVDGGPEPWRLQQFPFLAGLDPPQGLFPYDGGEGPERAAAYPMGAGQLRDRPPSSAAMHGQFPPVKMEVNNNNNNNNNQELNVSRQFLVIPGNDQYNAWTDLSGFTSSSTNNNHLL